MRWRQKPMTEAECYARCYGGPRRIEAVRPASDRPRLVATLSGEQIRRLFERRLDSREREAA
ncbi:MAG: hypothetical protein H0W87_03385 [Actinobacteria bacterium]|nr:hypothetical protein [Actinomycetota bacterium]